MAEKNITNSEAAGRLTYILVGLFAIAAIIDRLYAILFESYGTYTSTGTTIIARIFEFFSNYVMPFFKTLSFVVSVAAVIGIFYILRELGKIEEEEKKKYGYRPVAEAPGAPASVKNGKWERIIELINSANSSDWRVAIIEADILLQELLERSGYHGETVGDMLKSVEPSDFPTLDAAWEAHKIRNNIAHSGSEFQLNEREAKRAVSLYETVFKEFKII